MSQSPPKVSFDFFQPLVQKLASRQSQGLSRQRYSVEAVQGTRLEIDGKRYLAFSSNDYLGFKQHPRVIAAAQNAAATLGVGAGASHLLGGHFAAHHDLEHTLAAFVEMPRALLFSSGYMANIGVVTALVGRGDAIFSDRLNHASLNDAAVLSRAKLHRYPHCDLPALEKILSKSVAPRKLVMSDAVFSMDGDIAPVRELVELCECHNAFLLLDDAHGFGILGKNGRGTLSHFEIQSPRVIYMATLGKAMGAFGAFVAGNSAIIETLIQYARTYIYTTAIPPLLASSVAASVALLLDEPQHRQHLQRLIPYFKNNVNLSAWQLLPSSTAIQAIVVGDSQRASEISAALLERGLLVPAIRPPTVPQGSARLRISLSATHSLADVALLIKHLHDLDVKVG